jgi:N-acetylmuramoyl-L-alanine amidase
MSSPATIAICIGHSRRVTGSLDGGAESCDSVSSEWAFNDALGRLIVERLHEAHGLTAILVNDYKGESYGSAMRWLAGYLRGLGNIKLAVELHFNSDEDPAANGHEWLYWHASPKGKLVAAVLAMEMTLSHLGIRSRGVKPKDSGDRGSEFLRLTHCPAVICEPFFGSNAKDWETARRQPEAIAIAIAQALASVLPRL